MSKFTKNIILMSWVAVFLTACGGSSDSGGASPGPVGANLKFAITPAANNIPSNSNSFPASVNSPYYTSVNVNVSFTNDAAVPEGTTVQLTSSNPQILLVSLEDDPDTELDELNNLSSTASNITSGGNATFYIHSAENPGTVTLTASAVDPQTNRTATGTIQYTVSQGPEPFDRLTIEAVRQTLPANVFNLTPEQAFRTVYNTEVEISFRDLAGNFVQPGGADGQVEVSINPLAVASFSTLDDPETNNVNEIFVTLGAAPVDVAAGKAKIFIWARDPGVATITVTAFDQFTNQNISAQYDITVVSGGDVGLPSSIDIQGSGANYVNGSGGDQSQVIQAFVESVDVPVTDPNGFNNVMIEFTTDAQNSGENISGIDANGNAVSGQSIKLGTNNGVASFQLLSGNNPNTVIMTATTDRADNNVDNGLQDPITAQNNFVISDGVLFGLDITSPNLNSLFINNVDETVVTEDGIGNLDGSYSMTISAIATDKGGNPALPQTIQFGLIDSPIDGYPNEGPGTFAISGFDGDPEEGGDLFTSASAEFLIDAGGVQPSDTLLVFGEELQGNEDLESSVTVQSVLSNTSLRISESFNRNDLTGSINNDLGIFPYIIGRAVDGNINATAVVDENGVASTEINYPVSKLGKIAGVYAKGQGATINGNTRSVTDVELLLYAGAANVPGTDLAPFITVSPSVIPANNTTAVTVCVLDAASNPIGGASVQWAYLGGSGTGSIDGVAGSGVMANTTGPDGCATGLAEASGIIEVTDGTGYIFNVGSISCLSDTSDSVCIQIADPGAIYLSATPAIHNSSGLKVIDLFLFGGNGQGIPDVPLFASCESDGGSLTVQAEPGTTDENGMTIANIFAALNGFNESFSGTCTFTTGTGTPEAVVQFNGYDLCAAGVSPVVPQECNP